MVAIAADTFRPSVKPNGWNQIVRDLDRAIAIARFSGTQGLILLLARERSYTHASVQKAPDAYPFALIPAQVARETGVALVTVTRAIDALILMNVLKVEPNGLYRIEKDYRLWTRSNGTTPLLKPSEITFAVKGSELFRTFQAPAPEYASIPIRQPRQVSKTTVQVSKTKVGTVENESSNGDLLSKTKPPTFENDSKTVENETSPSYIAPARSERGDLRESLSSLTSPQSGTQIEVAETRSAEQGSQTPPSPQATPIANPTPVAPASHTLTPPLAGRKPLPIESHHVHARVYEMVIHMTGGREGREGNTDAARICASAALGSLNAGYDGGDVIATFGQMIDLMPGRPYHWAPAVATNLRTGLKQEAEKDRRRAEEAARPATEEPAPHVHRFKIETEADRIWFERGEARRLERQRARMPKTQAPVAVGA